jgi:hypothetical protein
MGPFLFLKKGTLIATLQIALREFFIYFFKKFSYSEQKGTRMQNAPPYGAKRRLRVDLSAATIGTPKDPQPLPYLYYRVFIPAYSAPPSHEYTGAGISPGKDWVKDYLLYSLLYLSLCYWVYYDRRMGEGY